MNFPLVLSLLALGGCSTQNIPKKENCTDSDRATT